MAEVKAPNFTLDDLKNPAYWYRVGNQQKNVYSLIYNINGQQYTFLPTDYIQKGFRDGNTQYVDKAFLNKDTLNTIFQAGVGVDLDGVAAGWALNGLKNTGFDTKGILVPSSVLSSAGVGSPVNYQIDNSRNGGAVKGLTEYNGQYIYAQDLTGDRAKASYIDATGNRKAEFTKVRGGFLGNLIVDVAEGFASVPGLPEIVSAVTGGNPLVYASLKGLQTAGSGGDLDDVIKSGLTAYVAKGGLEGIDPGLNKAVQTAMVAANSDNPLEAVAKLYGQEILEGSGVSDAIEDAIAGVVGEDIVNAVKDNENIVNTALDVAKGKDLSEAIADNMMDDIIDATGADTTNEKALVAAAVKAAEAADQGGDALGSAAEEYYKRDGSIGDIDIYLDIDSELIAGVGDLLDGLPNLDFNIPELPDLPDLPEVALDIPEVNLPELPELPDVSIDLPEVALDIPEVDIPDINVDMPELPSVDLPEVALEAPELPELPDVNLPEVDIPELPEVALEIPEVEGPDIDIQKPTLDLLDFSGLLGGLSLGLSSSGKKGTTPAGNIGGSAYQTQFDFLRNVEPLGTIGMFGRNKA